MTEADADRAALPHPERFDMLSFEALRDTNKRRCEAAFHQVDTWKPWEWSNAMAGEGGELAVECLAIVAALGKACNLTKKMGRVWPANQFIQNWNKPEDQRLSELADRLAGEVADVVIYADLLMTSIGRTLGDAVRQKFNEKSDEIGSSIKLEPDDPAALAGRLRAVQEENKAQGKRLLRFLCAFEPEYSSRIPPDDEVFAKIVRLRAVEAQLDQAKYTLSLDEFSAREKIWRLLADGVLVLTADRQLLPAAGVVPSPPVQETKEHGELSDVRVRLERENVQNLRVEGTAPEVTAPYDISTGRIVLCSCVMVTGGARALNTTCPIHGKPSSASPAPQGPTP